MNELLEMAARLDGYSKENFYEITKAVRNGDEWVLTVKHTNTADSEVADDESNE